MSGYISRWPDGIRQRHRKGIVRVEVQAPEGDALPEKAAALEIWLDTLSAGFADRILPVNEAIAQEWGRMGAGHALLPEVPDEIMQAMIEFLSI